MQSSLVSATHHFMAQAKHVCTELIDQAALNAAELMTKTTNVILHPATGSVFLFAFQEALALGSLTGMRLIWDHYNAAAAASASLSPSSPPPASSLPRQQHVFRCRQMSNYSTISLSRPPCMTARRVFAVGGLGGRAF